jgi:hypothetical protein
LRYYPQFQLPAVQYELPMIQGWALLAYAKQSDAWAGYELAGDGYIAQERERLT